MNTDTLRAILDALLHGSETSNEGAHVVSRALRAHRPLVSRLTKSHPSAADRSRAYVLVLREAFAHPPLLGSATRALTDRLVHLSAAPSRILATPLEALVAELLASWPAVPSADFSSRLEGALSTSGTPDEHETPDDGPTDDPASPSSSDNQEDTMAFDIDVRGLPPALQDDSAKKQYISDVTSNLKVAIGAMEPTEEIVAYAVGKLLRTGQYGSQSASFYSFVKRAWDDLTALYKARSGNVAGLAILQKVVKVLSGITNGSSTPTSTPKKTTAQQLAFIFNEVLTTLGTIAPEDSGFANRIDRAYLDYASGEVGYDNFDIPDLDASADATDIIPENMIAVGKLYAAFQFERLKLFSVVDRISELWKNGLIPIGNDSGGQLLNQFFWERDERLPEGARAAIYGRLFGMKGVDVSKDVQPNTTFDSLMQRFLTNVAQLKRLEEQVVVATPADSKTLAAENVRKTGRELASNLSLYGWGGSHFDSSRIAAHIDFAFKIVSDAQVQKAFAATTPWQVIERVSQQEFGVTPNIVMFHTMARAGRRVIEILAQNPNALGMSGMEFQDALDANTSGILLSSSGVRARPTWDDLARNALAWLSVNGVTGDQLATFARPIEAIASPTLPSMPAQQPSPGMNQLRSMVASGQMPSLDQLQRMFVN